MMKETKDVAILVARLGNALSAAMKDGEFGIGDMMAFGPVAAAIPAAIAKCSDIPAEIANATDADKEDLLDSFCKEFSISSAAAEQMVEKTLEVVVAIWKFVR